MSTINGKACVVDGVAVDKVFSNGRQVYGRNMLTGTSDHTVKGSGSFINGLLSNETADGLLTLFKGLEGKTVTVSVDYEYSGFVYDHGSNFNRIGWEISFMAGSIALGVYGAWYDPNNDSGSGRVSTTFVVPKNITRLVEYSGYIELPGGGTGTLSHLKLEKGTTATPWTPAPEDILK